MSYKKDISIKKEQRMQIPTARIEQLKSLYKTAFGCELTDEEAQSQGLAILRLVAIRNLDIPAQKGDING